MLNLRDSWRLRSLPRSAAFFALGLTPWLDTVQNSPDKARPHNNLGFAYALEGEPENARQHYLTALRLQPDYELARNNLARLSAR
jgi:protein O-mannosyl-transferase